LNLTHEPLERLFVGEQDVIIAGRPDERGADNSRRDLPAKPRPLTTEAV